MGVEKHWQTANGGLGAFEMRSTQFDSYIMCTFMLFYLIT